MAQRMIGSRVKVQDAGGRETVGYVSGPRKGNPGAYPVRFLDGTERMVTHSDIRGAGVPKKGERNPVTGEVVTHDR